MVRSSGSFPSWRLRSPEAGVPPRSLHSWGRIRRLEREVEFQDGEDFPLRKQYLRTLVYVTLSEDVQAPTLRASVTDAMDVPLKEVYVFRGGKTALYAWISRSQLQHYKTPEGEQQLSAWLSLLKFDAPEASDNLNMDLEELLQGR